MEQIFCKECQKILSAEEVIEEGRGKELTCPHCGMMESLTVIYTPEQRKQALADFNRVALEGVWNE